MTRVAFRIDASANSGAGHLARCTTLARELARRGAEIVVALSTEVEQYCSSLQAEGFAVRRMPSDASVSAPEDARQFLSGVAAGGPLDWIVVDHYGLAREWESEARVGTRHMLVMDDLPAREHDCDVLVDQNLRAAHSYAPYVPAAAAVLAGPRYALLREEFAQLHGAHRERGGAIRTVLVCFGSADPRNHTSAAVEALEAAAASLEVTVVLGAANANRATVEAACRKLPSRKILAAPPNLAALLAQSDLVIGAGGTMTWERACVGAPTIAIGIAANQVDVVTRVLEEGCALGVAKMLEPDVATLRALVVAALASPATMAGMARRALRLVDGNGARRVADTMVQDEVSLRAATMADSDAILRWRNHPSIRAVSLEGGEIPPQAHREWMQATLANPHRALLIAERRREPLGVVRFDFDAGAATISLYRVPGSGGGRIGLVRHAVEWLRSHRPDVSRVIARVRADNRVSLAAFLSAGFEQRTHELVRELRP